MRKVSGLWTLAAITLLAGVTVGGAWAQAAGPAGGSIKGNFAGQKRGGVNPQGVFFKSIGLTKDQAKKLQALRKETLADFKTFREQHQGDAQALKDFRKQQQTKMDQGMQAILTPDQYAKFQKWQAESRFPELNNDRRAIAAAALDQDAMQKVRQLKVKELENYLTFLAGHLDDEAAIQTERTTILTDYRDQLQKALTPSQWQAYTQGLTSKRSGFKRKNG